MKLAGSSQLRHISEHIMKQMKIARWSLESRRSSRIFLNKSMLFTKPFYYCKLGLHPDSLVDHVIKKVNYWLRLGPVCQV